MNNDSTARGEARGRRHAAGWFDIRNIIGALLGIYGVVLLLTQAFGGSSRTTSGSTPSHANLWVGLALLVGGIIFVVWATVRPTVVDEAELAEQKSASESGGPGEH
jgi:hypothetical protein